jgi:hypothetical protein
MMQTMQHSDISSFLSTPKISLLQLLLIAYISIMVPELVTAIYRLSLTAIALKLITVLSLHMLWNHTSNL